MTDRFTAPTGKSMAEWLALLDNPHNMPHKEMAAFFVQQGVSAWWAQGLTVAIEQHIGRRVVGQTCTGTWSASVSKTVPGERAHHLRDGKMALLAHAACRRQQGRHHLPS